MYIIVTSSIAYMSMSAHLTIRQMDFVNLAFGAPPDLFPAAGQSASQGGSGGQPELHGGVPAALLLAAVLGGLVGGADHQLGGHGVLLPLPRHYRDQGASPTRPRVGSARSPHNYMSGEYDYYYGTRDLFYFGFLIPL